MSARPSLAMVAAAAGLLLGCPPPDALGTGRGDASVPGAEGDRDAGDEVARDAAPARSCAPQPPSPVLSRYAPPRVSRGACREEDLVALATCFATKKVSQCEGVLGAVPEACRSCIFSSSTDATWGPLVRYEGGAVVPNQGGCWATALPSDGGVGCGPAIHRRAECQVLVSCGACTDPAPGETRGCFRGATEEGGACRALQAEEQACTFPLVTDGPGQAAFSRCIQTNFEMPTAYWRGLFASFCGP